MACTLTIQDVLGAGQPGGPLTSLLVKGSATGCQQATVSIVCTQQAVQHTGVPVVAGQWETTFTEAELKIAGCRECGSPQYPITVRAHCADPGADCGDAKVLSQIPCSAACPTITVLEADIPSCAEVTAQGAYVVTFTAQISGQNVGLCKWNFGDGTPPQNGPLPQSGIATIQHAYACAGTYVVVLTILSDCEPYYTDDELLEIALPPCGCPSISISAEVSATNPCTWNFKASLSGPFTACIEAYLWHFGDGSQPAQTPVASATHTYAHDGEYDVTLTLLGDLGAEGGGACSAVTQIEVDGCRGGDGDGDGRPCRPIWHPRCWSLCGLLGALLTVLIGAYIVGIATGVAADISAQLTWLAALGVVITAEVLIGVVGGFIAAAMAAYLTLCGSCNLAKVMIAGGVLGILGIIALFVAGVPVPYWVGAVVAAVFIIAAGWLLYARECD